MTRHVLDRPRKAAPTRTKSYLEVDRREGLHPSTRALLRRGRPDMQARIKHFIAIARTTDRTT
jgi:hypothetical protein